MKLVVTDTNVFIDLLDCKLVRELFELPFEIHTTEFVLYELFESQFAVLGPFIETGHLRVKKFDELEMKAIHQFQVMSKGVQKRIADRSVLYLADSLGAVLLGGDSDLRKEAEKRQVEVHGSIWLFEQFYLEKIQSAERMINNLEKLIQVNPRIPTHLVRESIQKLVNPT
jgi:rRNA-processing protein FCF1